MKKPTAIIPTVARRRSKFRPEPPLPTEVGSSTTTEEETPSLRAGRVFILGAIGLLIAGVLLLKFLEKKEEGFLPPWRSRQEKPAEKPPEEGFVGFEESKRIAEEAVKNAPTYKFDGFDLKFIGSETLRCPSCWEFTFSFQSRQAGYGDRAGQILAQVITPHTIRTTVDNGKITSLVTDRTFDELNQKFLK